MIIVRVELHSAITGQVQELARMHIANDGSHPNPRMGNYSVRTLRGRSAKQLDCGETQRRTELSNWPRLQLHVWNLVFTALGKLGYRTHEK